MRASRAAALMACASLAIGLAACGGDDDDEEEAATPQPTTQPETTTEAAPKPTTGGLTPPGTKLAFGESATVGWNPPSLSLEGSNKVIKLEVAVVSLEKGTQADLKDINLDPDQRRSTPYFLKVQLRNLGGTGPREDDPDITFDAIDDRGQEQGSVTFIGDFPRCEDTEAPKPFSRGKEYESCLTYLVPGGGAIEEVRWRSGPAPRDGVSEYFEKPIVWRAG